jgi:hypothetical protein
MKIRLRESQYSRLIKENNDFGSLGNRITHNIIKFFKFLDTQYTSEDLVLNREKIIEDLKKTVSLSEKESEILLFNYQNRWRKGDKNVEKLLGQPLDWVGTYLIEVLLPTEVTTRTYMSGFVEVSASSPEEAIENASVGLYSDMFFDETSEEYGNPNLDYDLDSDGVIQEDMVVDYLRHTPFNEIKNSIKLKK